MPANTVSLTGIQGKALCAQESLQQGKHPSLAEARTWKKDAVRKCRIRLGCNPNMARTNERKHFESKCWKCVI